MSLLTVKSFTRVMESTWTPWLISKRFRRATVIAARLAIALAWAMLAGLLGGAPIPTATTFPVLQLMLPWSNCWTTSP